MVRQTPSSAPFSATTAQGPRLICTAQQSRFHSATLASAGAQAGALDLRDVSIAVAAKSTGSGSAVATAAAGNELLAGADVRLKHGTRYALIGRNGTGKSTLLRALADKLIPGMPSTTRVFLLSQLDDAQRSAAATARISTGGQGSGEASVVQHVVRGDEKREALLSKLAALEHVVERADAHLATSYMRQSALQQALDDLDEARLVAERRSGARGKKAREGLVAKERDVEDARDSMRRAEGTEGEVDDEALTRASQRLADVQLDLDSLDASTTDARASQILTGLGFSREMMDGPYRSLSGGWRSRASLAIALLVQSDLLLLDEVSNYLDLPSIIWTERFLSEHSPASTLVLTSHDQAFLDAVAEETIVIRHKQLRYFAGNPSAFYVEERKGRKRTRGQMEALQRKKDHIEKSIQQGKAAAKKSGDDNKLRMAKSRQKKLDDRFGLEQSAKGGHFKLNRDLEGFHLTSRAEVTLEELEADAKISLPDPAPLRTKGDLVHLDDVSYSHPPRRGAAPPSSSKPLLENVRLTIPQDARIALVGKNGQGKSTLAKLIAGQLAPTKGKVVRHAQLRIGFFTQHAVEELSAEGRASKDWTALRYLEEEAEQPRTEQELRALLGALGLKGSIVSHAPLSALSGGQKVRVALARILIWPPPLLILDEVTTHVDFSTCQALARALRRYQGAIVLITHDRAFSRVVVDGEKWRDIQADQAGADLSEDDDDDDDDDADESDENEGSAGRAGQTYRVGAGKLTLLERGMQQYVETLERRLAKQGVLQ